MSGEETPGDGVEIEFEEAEGDAAMLEQRNAPAGPVQVFAGTRIAIVTANEGIEKILSRAFINRGGEAEVFHNGANMVREGKKNPFQVVVVSEDVPYNGADYIGKAIRSKKLIQVDVLWFVGRKPLRVADGFTRRPFRPIELLKPVYEKLREIQQRRGESGEKVQERPVVKGPAPDGKKVLVIDDEEGLREVTEMILAKQGYRVLTACNGEEGLKKVGTNPDLALMIVDLKMPVMNGLQFLNTLKAMGAGAQIPKIVMTAFTQKSTIDKARKLNISAWLTKPSSSQTILNAVEKCLGKKDKVA